MNANQHRKSVFLWIEWAFLFLLVPIVLWQTKGFWQTYFPKGSYILFFLLLISSILFCWGRTQEKDLVKQLFCLKGMKKGLLSLLWIFIPSFVFWSILGVFVLKEQAFFLCKVAPFRLLLILMLYPILSVFPQGIIYRWFFFFRYRVLFGSKTFLFVSAVCFSLTHLIFDNLYALIFTFLGGLLFAYRYQRTGSFLVSTIEHALYGNMLFFIGWGQYLVAA